jgi:mannose-1-phosphate guanylyltransferase / mannose-6-phosphate isomerase
VKAIVAALETQGRTEKHLHYKVHRPWGWYDSIDAGLRFRVKSVMVKPGASLSLQMNHHRAKHWLVLSGTAEVVNGDKAITLTPLSRKHAHTRTEQAAATTILPNEQETACRESALCR